MRVMSDSKGFPPSVIVLFAAVAAVLLGGCAAFQKPLPPVAVQIPSRPVDYLEEVKPILDRRCVVCHSCYNSPCQLKLSSFEGVDRGGTKQLVYHSSRLRTADPTRLFTDAASTAEWRDKGFFSVTDSSVSDGWNDSAMLQLLSHKMKNPELEGDYFSEASDLTCAENGKELGSYLEKHPSRGMPFGFPPLKQEEFEIIAGWLAQGAAGPDTTEQEKLTSPKESDAAEIEKWESFLNGDDPKHAVTARYLYEHLFLAHLKFGTSTNEYYEMVRSRSAPGTPIDLIVTVRPYDDPGPGRVYYRFRKIHSTIVHKTHMVFDLDDPQLGRFRELFIEPEWLEEPHRVGYEPKLSANPFVAFEQIPPRSRYQFLLDNAHYIIMTFIRGPVCKGQVALNVIDDQFWVMFMDPDHDLTVRNPAFLKLHSENLRMPIEKGSDIGIFKALSNKYHKGAIEFYQARQDYYMSHRYYEGLGYDFIWKGLRPTDAPLLTVFRHFDSASVHKGVLGDLPKTMWVMDYSLMERIYYALVAGFDVYGSAGHQLSVRLYMDALRVEGESNFLEFLPESMRREIMQSWYEGVDLKKVYYHPTAMPARISFVTDDPKREFTEHVVNEHILPETGIVFDPVNYLSAGETYPPLPEKYETVEDYLQGFRAVSAPGTPFFSLVNDYNANLAYVRIRVADGEDVVLSVVINRWHKNVAFLFGEGGALDPARDRADFIKGFIGSYPNSFIDIREEDLPDFFDLLATFALGTEDAARFLKYGVNRADEQLWETYDWFQERFNKDEPVRAGLFDLNRYYHKVLK
jgi:hypothetical protein